MEIKLLNKISPVGLEKLDPAVYHIGEDVENPDGILLRSFAMHDMELPASLKAVARCGAGVNNIPIDKCSEQGIVVFNTPGANANAVKELVITALLLSSTLLINTNNGFKPTELRKGLLQWYAVPIRKGLFISKRPLIPTKQSKRQSNARGMDFK